MGRSEWGYDSEYYRSRCIELHEKNPTWSNAQIARFLGISPSTVGVFLRKIRRQERVSS